jgi:hypothetical protein
MPRRVKVGHRFFEIIRWETKAADASKARGECQQEPPVIRIANYMKPFDKAEVMLHELGHACWGDRPTDGVSEENAVTWLAAGYAGVWADNPDLVAWISESLKRT